MKTTELLTQLLLFCIEKGLSFDHTPNQFLVVSKFDNTKSEFTYRKAAWFGVKDDLNNKQIEELINEVKNYQPC